MPDYREAELTRIHMRKISKAYPRQSQLAAYKGRFYAVSDEYAVSSVSKCGCSTVALQTLLYYKQVTEEECAALKHRRIKEKHPQARRAQKMHDGLKVWIFRDPVERFVSAYFSTDGETDWPSFLEDKAPKLVTWERHFLPQAQYHEGEAPDVYVELKDYGAFCREHGIPVFPANVNASEAYRKFRLSETDNLLIRQLYAEDYALLEQIRQSGKCYLPNE